MLGDFVVIFGWWLLLFSLGVVVFPLTFFFFEKFFDGGYSFSKIIGVILLSYLTWIVSSVGLSPFGQSLVVTIFVLLSFVGFWTVKTSGGALFGLKRLPWGWIVAEELLFFIALFFWTTIRAFSPDVRGLEKFMDLGFVNSILQSTSLPPPDMWFAGGSINYYYFGHFVTAVLTKLSGIPSSVVYNLMLATLFALSFTASFSLGVNMFFLTPARCFLRFAAGGATAIFITLSSNLHPVYYLLTSGDWLFQKYNYPDATRFITEEFGAFDNTIHEFPIYSFVVSDLHAHLFNLPFVLLFIACMLLVYRSPSLIPLSRLYFFVFPVLLGILYMTNSWDFPVYYSLLGLVSFSVLLRTHTLNIYSFSRLSLILIWVGGFSFISVWPFLSHFSPISKSLSLSEFKSPIWMLFVLWGWPFVVTLLHMLVIAFKRTAKRSLPDADFLVLILLGLGWFLILFPEFFYVRDIYTHSYQRANTMFKFTYQSFVLFGICYFYVFYRLVHTFSVLLPTRNLILRIWLVRVVGFMPLLFVLAATSFYSYLSIRVYYGEKTYQGLSGEGWIRREYPGEYSAILWMRQHLKDQPFILEASGDSYTDFNFISAYTGLPTVQGWFVHEWLWRGGEEVPKERRLDVEQIYLTPSASEALSLTRKYKVAYVVVGSREREKYPGLSEDKFRQIGRVVFSNQTLSIYKTL